MRQDDAALEHAASTADTNHLHAASNAGSVREVVDLPLAVLMDASCNTLHQPKSMNKIIDSMRLKES